METRAPTIAEFVSSSAVNVFGTVPVEKEYCVTEAGRLGLRPAVKSQKSPPHGHERHPERREALLAGLIRRRRARGVRGADVEDVAVGEEDPGGAAAVDRHRVDRRARRARERADAGERGGGRIEPEEGLRLRDDVDLLGFLAALDRPCVAHAPAERLPVAWGGSAVRGRRRAVRRPPQVSRAERLLPSRIADERSSGAARAGTELRRR